MANQTTEHKRRVRYAGKYPKKFEDKYKEHNPEKYADIVEHVIQKGSTPAGMHRSIMVEEILSFLQIKPGQTGIDATLGYGGHTRRMLEQLEGKGHIYGLDVDPIESEKTKNRLRNAGFGEDILTVELTNFANIDDIVKKAGKVDFVLADLGVSSMQIDDPRRGFSYKIDGPLDLRMNPNKGVSASGRLHEITMQEFAGMLYENSDEPYAQEIAEKVYFRMSKGDPMDTTTALREAIEAALVYLPKEERQEAIKKACQRTFQALRIDVNSEFEVLYTFLEKLPSVLKPGGRVAILTFHSGEDRLVKQSFKRLWKDGVYSEIARDVIRPSAQECRSNGRAKSTKMRWAIRAGKEETELFAEELINWESGLSYNDDDPEFYRIMLSAYVKESTSKKAKLAEAIKKQDWETYTVEIHSLKGTSKMMGADGLYEKALELEKAGKTGDFETITEKHISCMELYDKVLQAITGRLQKEDSNIL